MSEFISKLSVAFFVAMILISVMSLFHKDIVLQDIKIIVKEETQ